MANAKLPYLQFYPGDWVQDTRVLSLAAKGAWIDILCAMWSAPERGKLSLPWPALARLIGATEDEARAVVEELVETGVCEVGEPPCNGDVTQPRNGRVTLVSRRMVREEKARQKNRLRVQRHRERRAAERAAKTSDGERNGDVTPYISEVRSQKSEVREEIKSPPDGGLSSPAVADDAPAAPRSGGKSRGKKARPPCPHEDIIALYHDALPELPRVRVWSKQRRQMLLARWREAPERQNLDWWREYFAQVRASPFLMGNNDRGWQADLEWLVRPQNLPKVLEGRYRDRHVAGPDTDPFAAFANGGCNKECAQ